MSLLFWYDIAINNLYEWLPIKRVIFMVLLQADILILLLGKLVWYGWKRERRINNS